MNKGLTRVLSVLMCSIVLLVAVSSGIAQAASGYPLTIEPLAYEKTAAPSFNEIATNGAGAYIAVGDGGVVSKSTDLTTWTAKDSGVFSNITSVTYGAGIFVAVTNEGALVYSTDNGDTWTADLSASAYSINKVRYIKTLGNGNKLFAFVGAKPSSTEMFVAKMAEFNGTSFTYNQIGPGPLVAGTATNNQDAYSLAYDPATEKMIIVGSGNNAANEGIIVGYNVAGYPTSQLSGGGASGWHTSNLKFINDVIYANTQFLAVTGNAGLASTAAVLRSNTTFNLPTTPAQTANVFPAANANVYTGSSLILNAVAANANTLVAVGTGGKFIKGTYGASSWNAVTMNPVAIAGAGDLNGIIWDGTQFVAVGTNGTIAKSADATSWTVQNVVQSAFDPIAARRMATDGSGNYVLVGCILNAAGQNTTGYIYEGSYNAGLGKIVWSSTPSFIGANIDESVYAVAWTGSTFVASGSSAGQAMILNKDGATWTKQLLENAPGVPMLTGLAGLAVNAEPINAIPAGQYMVATGNGGTYTESLDGGTTWSPGKFATGVSLPTANYTNLTWYNGKFIMVGGQSVIYTFDPSQADPYQQWKTLSYDPTFAINIQGVAVNGTKMVVTGNRGQIMYTDDYTATPVVFKKHAYDSVNKVFVSDMTFKGVERDMSIASASYYAVTFDVSKNQILAAGEAGTMIASTDGINWYAVNNGGMNTTRAIYPIEDSKIYGLSEGMTFVTGTSIPVTGIILEPTTANVVTGSTITLTATVAPENATLKSVDWTTSDASVATVNSNGIVTGVADGSATITATTFDGSFSASCNVTVGTVYATGLILDNTDVELQVGGKKGGIVGVTVLPVDTSDKSITWESSNPDVAFMDPLTLKVNSGYVTGTAVITARSNSNPLVTATINVRVGVPAETVELDKETMNLFAGSTDTLTQIVTPVDAMRKGTWATSDASVATVSDGVVTAVAPGTATITFTTAVSLLTDTCEVTVTEVPVVHVTGITVDKATSTLFVGSTDTLTATVAPENAENKNITWSTSDSNVATVENGVVTAKAAGTATITVTTEDGSFTASCVVTVNNIPVPAPSDVKIGTSADAITGTSTTVVTGGDLFFKVTTDKSVDIILLLAGAYGEAYTASSQQVVSAVTEGDSKVWTIKRPFTTLGERTVVFKQLFRGWSEDSASVTVNVTLPGVSQVKVGTSAVDANTDSITVGTGSDLFFKVTVPASVTKLTLKNGSYTEEYTALTSGVTIENGVWTIFRPFSSIGADRQIQFIPAVNGNVGTESVAVNVSVVPVRVLDVKVSTDAASYASSATVNAAAPLYFKVVTDKVAQTLVLKVGDYSEIASNVTSVIEGNTKVWTVTRPFGAKGAARVVEFKAEGFGTFGDYSASVATVTVQ